MKKMIVSLLLLSLCFMHASMAQAALGDLLFMMSSPFDFDNPSKLAAGRDGNIYVLDRPQNTTIELAAVKVFDPAGNQLRQFSVPMWGPSGQYMAANAEGFLYMIDESLIKVFDPAGLQIMEWGGQGTEEGLMNGPISLDIDDAGNVYVADSGNNRIQVFDRWGNFLRAWPNTPVDTTAVPLAYALAVGPDGNIYLADGGEHLVKVFDQEGTLLRSWQVVHEGYYYGDYFFPQSIEVDAQGRVFATDINLQNVKMYDAFGNLLSVLYLSPYPNPYGLNDVTVDSAGRIYVANFTDRAFIDIYDPYGGLTGTWGDSGSGPGQFAQPHGIALDYEQNIYVTDSGNNKLMLFDPRGNFLSEVGGDAGSYPFPYPLPDPPPAGYFSSPNSVAVDRNGYVYVSDMGNNRIQVFQKDYNSTNLNFVTMWGGPGDQPGQFNYPSRLAVDNEGELFVVDQFNGRVQVFYSDGTFLRQWYFEPAPMMPMFLATGMAVNDWNVYITDEYGNRVVVYDHYGNYQYEMQFPDPDDPFYQPLMLGCGLAVDEAGRLYITSLLNRVIVSDFGLVRTFGELGSGNGQFNEPTGIAVDPCGSTIYVADINNSRVQVFEGPSELPVIADAGGDIHIEQYGPDGEYVWLRNRALPYGCGGDVTSFWTWPGGSAEGNEIYIFLPAGTTTVSLVAVRGSRTEESIANITVSDTVKPRLRSRYSTIPGGVSIDLEGDDGVGSGVKEIHYVKDGGAEAVVYGDRATISFTEEGIHSFSAYAVDRGDNRSDTLSDPLVVVDNSPPVTEYTIAGTESSPGVYSSDVTLTVTPTDAVSGPESLYWYSYTGDWLKLPPEPIVITLSQENSYTFRFYAVDNAGLREAERMVSFSIVKAPPETVPTVSGSMGANGWYVSPVSVSLSAAAGSSINEIHYVIDGGGEVVVTGGSASFSLADDGTHTVSFWAVGTSGLQEDPRILSVNIDQTPPVITILGVSEGASFLLGNEPQPGYSAADGLSGLDGSQATLNGGGENGVGPYAYTVEAVDKAGNVAVTTVNYSVVYDFSGALLPSNADKPIKLGSTLPIKFRLQDFFGTDITTASAGLSLQMISDNEPVGEAIELMSTEESNTGTVFTFDTGDKQYHYNLRTGGLHLGTWRATIGLDDGTKNSFTLMFK